MRWLSALALYACVSACSNKVGTVQVELITATDDHVLDGVETLRVTLTQPREVREVARTASGFDLALELDATGGAGALVIEGLDAAGALVACGQSPRFPISALDARIAIFIAAPRSIAIAPEALSGARSDVAAAALDYGAVIAGGRDAAGVPASSIAIYNAYDHSLVEGVALPAPRAGLAITATSAGQVFLFGGTGGDGAPTGTLWRFDTNIAPNGAAFALSDDPSLARSGQRVIAADDRYLITGTPAIQLVNGVASARGDVTGVPAVGARVRGTSLIFAGAPLVRYADDVFSTLEGSAASDGAATTLPDGRVIFVGGASRDATIVAADGVTASAQPALLAVPRVHPVVAATARHLLVAGGSDADGAPIASAELFDATTLEPLATLPILARSGGFAIALPTDQVLIGGGAPAAAQLELFTPEPPAAE